MIVAIIYAAVGAFAFRGRGGMFNEALSPVFGKLSTHAGRVLYGAMMAALAYRHGMGWAPPPFIAAAFFVGAVAPWFTDTNRSATTLNGFMAQTMRGLVFVVPPAVVIEIAGHNPVWLCASGVTLGACYLLAAKIPSRVHDLEQGPALGEALFGAVMGGSLGL